MFRKKVNSFSVLYLSFFLFLILNSLSLTQDKLLQILTDELNREMTELKKQEIPPYFISYSVTQTKSFWTSASFGTLNGSSESDESYLSVSIRIGDYNLDNTHEIRGDQISQYSYLNQSKVQIPTDEGKEAIRNAIWTETNRLYRKAVESYSKVKANVAVKVKEENQAPDFSRELKPENYYEAPLDFEKLLGDISVWKNKVKKYSQPFLKEPNIFTANSTFYFQVVRKYLINSEGTSIAQNLTSTNCYVNSVTKSPDGMELPIYKSYFALEPSRLPEDQTILKDVDILVQKLKALYASAEVEPYTGPALLSGRASSVFFHEIFGHRVEGQRLKKTEDAQTFKKKINEKVLPEAMSVTFDPTFSEYKGMQLNGFYKYDDEGVLGRQVKVVESGILKRFLMSRSPLETQQESNGHARAQVGFSTVTRQSNLIVESTSHLSIDELRQKLIDECKKQGKEFGLLFDDVVGGFTMTGRFIPNAFNVTPTLVYKVFIDGRPDEIVRGVDLVGTPLTVFSNIAYIGGEYEVFNGTCGAESGGVPVSCVSPALLVSQIEVQKKVKSQEKPPILPRPDLEKAP